MDCSELSFSSPNRRARVGMTRRAARRLGMSLLIGCCLSFCAATSASQIDIQGPPHSVGFGTTVTALPSGNFVVCDPDFGPNGKQLGAVYVYGPTGALISTLRGNSGGDRVGLFGIVVLPNGNFVVRSPLWSDGKNTQAGAVTWVDGHTGMSGVVSASNSLVGTQMNDSVGTGIVTVLNNGNFIVASPGWSNGPVKQAGAVTWVDGSKGLTGPVSPDNSLVGMEENEVVGGWQIAALPNGNYVVPDPNWQHPGIGLGAVRLADGWKGTVGTFTADNSLTGTTLNDAIGSGGIVVLSNGNYVVSSPSWNNIDAQGGGVADAGAVTWVNGKTGLVGQVSASNSLVGTLFLDEVGSSFDLHPIVPLTNGNYVVTSSGWRNGAVYSAGAVTLGNGVTGTSGPVSATNSLVGSTINDRVGFDHVAALSNGNFVVGSRYWHNGAIDKAGAVTWVDGTIGLIGLVSSSNSLVGTSVFDWVGSQGIRALTNGNYVVTSPRWSNGSVAGVGAITWASGEFGLTGDASLANSLIGSTAGDGVGAGNVVPLANGNYVVNSPFWNNDAAMQAGAVTWANGMTGLIGVVSPTNSLVGTSANDQVGYNFATALANGNYVVASPGWSNGAMASVGAVTLGNGQSGTIGPVSPSNSLIGSIAGDSLGSGFDNSNGFRAYPNSTYVVASPHFHNGSTVDAGAVTLLRGTGGNIGIVSPGNSVIGTIAGGGTSMTFDYDPIRDTLIVGRPSDNTVSLFKADLLFADGFQ